MRDIKLVIGDKNYSSWSICPWLMLKMFNVDFEEINIKLFQDNTAEKLGPYSPSLKVPVMLHGDTTVWDSLAICEFISETLLGGAGWPSNLKSRANARSIAAEVHSGFPTLKKEWPMNCATNRTLAPSEALQEEIARIDAIWGNYRQRFGEGGPYLFGRFSVADSMFAATAISFESYGVELSESAGIYMETLLHNSFVSDWKKLGRKEKEHLFIAYAESA